MARDSKRVNLSVPDNIYAVIESMCEASGESITEYCARAVVTKAEHDLMVKLPEKWQAFTANIEPKQE
ncbi:hypothetical protein [Pseudanabaena minima]|uniref:hypothetical protein n=1 Tax=Pseudanabaena minima TaxID=890415 RepID=UPI003DA7D7D4